MTIPRRHYNDLKAEIKIDEKIIAPIDKGQILGIVNVSLADNIVASMKIVALDSVSEGSIVQRLYDEALLLLE